MRLLLITACQGLDSLAITRSAKKQKKNTFLSEKVAFKSVLCRQKTKKNHFFKRKSRL